MKLKDKQLVILTTHFGTNFSGGSTATCEIFSRLEQEFRGVTVIGTQLGVHPFKSLNFVKYNNWREAVTFVRQWIQQESVFYGDFYNAFLFLLARVPFYFTYHDNWPEMRQFGLKNRIRSLFYTTAYIRIFRSAKHVFSVSHHKAEFIRKFTDRVSVVRNGFSSIKAPTTEKTSNVLMAGNIDQRKYARALDLFRLLKQQGHIKVQIHIFGRVNDQVLADELSRFSFVRIMGFQEQVPYGDYAFLLHTSVMENLPITFCEALHNGLPVLAFNVGGSAEIIGANQGILVPPYSIERLAHAFVEMNKANEADFQCQVPTEYSWDVCSKEYLNIISTT
ncbi:MAG: glycosyltransferase family 4 protein [Cytophagales bacterium]|nr:glycosyltransferase family 4 protein [Cytophagales bacterium]